MLVSKKKYNESVKYVVESYNEEREEEKVYNRKKRKSFKLYVAFRKIACHNSL